MNLRPQADGRSCSLWLAALLFLPVLGSAQTLPSLPAADDGAARVVAREGMVSVLRGSVPWAIDTGQSIQIGQVIVTGPDGYARFELADGSFFEVFANSKVTFRSNPGNWRDLVDVWLGRIRVYIQKLGGQPNPNRVQTPTAIISVRGTVFEINVTDEDETTTVAVADGEVAVAHRLMPREGDPKVLKTGEELTVYRNVPLSAGHRIDRQRAAQFAAETLWQIMIRMPRIGGGSGSGGTGGGGPSSTPLPGDTGGSKTPPAPPPPPPPATPPAPPAP